MGKITSVNLDEEMVEYFQRENINVSAWIRDMMEQRMTGGADIDVTQMRIRELERDREDHELAMERIDQQLEELRKKADSQERIEAANESFKADIITLDKEFQAFPTGQRLRRSNAFRKRTEEIGMTPFEAAEKVIAYREAVSHE
jgi:vacuolar-type H+-ATPase subunit I/STV1